MKAVCVRTNEAATQPCWENYRALAVDRIVWSSAITALFSRALEDQV